MLPGRSGLEVELGSGVCAFEREPEKLYPAASQLPVGARAPRHEEHEDSEESQDSLESVRTSVLREESEEEGRKN